MPHTPFHNLQTKVNQYFDFDKDLAAQGQTLYEQSTKGYAANFAMQNNLINFSAEQQAALDEYGRSLRSKPGQGINFALNRLGGFKSARSQGGGLVGEFSDYLKDQGFSTQEALNFFKALDDDPSEFFGDKEPKEKGEKIRFLKEYFKEAQNLYQASADTEKEMIREEKASREQLEFDKAQREAFGLSDQQQGELADRQRKQQQSQQYLQSRGGMSSRQAQKSGMVMVPQARPV